MRWYKNNLMVTLVSITLTVATMDIAKSDSETILTRISPEDFIKLTQKIKTNDKETKEKMTRIKNQYFILFIPGIMGSKLYLNGDCIWGCSIKSDIEKLYLRSDSPKANASLFDYYAELKDVYGNFYHTIETMCGGNYEHEAFAYDWRQDLNDIASELDRKLSYDWKNSLQDKKVIIVAHSMGGLVAWTWKNNYLRDGKKYNFDVEHLMLVGSPLLGSCETLRMLILGYKPIPGIDYKVGKLYDFLFNDFRKAALTFPSLFQCLPKGDCFYIIENDKKYPQNHFNIDRYKFFFKEKELTSQFRSILENAYNFRETFDLSEEPLSRKISYYYSNDLETTKRITLGKKWFIFNDFQYEMAAGDGRVTEDSAINANNCSSIGISRLSDDKPLSHDKLLNCKEFLNYLDRDLRRSMNKRTVIDLSKLINNDPVSLRSFVKMNKILSAADLGLNIDDVATQDEVAEIVKLNANFLNKYKFINTNIQDGKLAIEIAGYFEKTLNNKELALPFYELSLILGGIDKRDEALIYNRYHLALKEENKIDLSLHMAQKSIDICKSQPYLFSDKQKAVFYNDLGLAYLKKDKIQESIEAFIAAEKLGSIVAIMYRCKISDCAIQSMPPMK